MTEQGQAIEPDHDQGFAWADLVQQAGQYRPAAVCVGGVLLEHRGADGRALLVELRVGALFLGRDTGQGFGAGGDPMSNLVARGSSCVRPDICLPRLNKACPNPSK